MKPSIGADRVSFREMKSLISLGYTISHLAEMDLKEIHLILFHKVPSRE